MEGYPRDIGIEDSQGNRIVNQKQVLKIWENYVTELYDRPNRPETLEVEPEEVDTDEKGPNILQSEVEKAIKEMRNKKAKEMMMYWRCAQVTGRRWFENIDNTNQHRIRNWTAAQGLHRSYNDCPKEEDTNYKMQRTSHNQPYFTYSKDNSKELEKGLKGKLRMYLEKISLDLEEEKELGMRLG